MDFIIVDGNLVLNVVGIIEIDSDMIGDETRSDSGQLRASIRAEKRRWVMTLLEMTEAELATIRQRFQYGNHVMVSGSAFNGASISVRGRLSDMGYEWTENGHLRTARLDLVQV